MKDAPLEDKFELKDKALNEILDTTVNKLKDTPYGKKLFENAVISTSASETQFNLSKIYIGHAGTGIGGNCYREIVDTNKTRDVVYISDEEIKSVIAKTLLKSDNPEIKNLIEQAGKQEITEPTSRFQDFLESHYNSMNTKPNQATVEQWDELKLFAQIEKITPLEKLIENKDIKNMLSDSLTHLVAHEVSHAGQFNNGCQAVTKQSFSIPALKKENALTDDELFRLSAPQSNNNNSRTFNEIKEGRAFENALEAGVMAPAMVAFVLTDPSQEAMQTTIDYYNLRSGKDTKEILDKYDLNKIRELEDDNNYTKEAINMQNSLARDIFVEVVKGMDKQQQDKLRIENSNADCSYDYSKGEALISINSSYRPEIYGDRKDFDASIKSIVSSNKITSLRNRINSSDVKVPFKPARDTSKIDFNTLKLYQNKRQNG